jgi:uncharacterized protein (TIGR02265 family)
VCVRRLTVLVIAVAHRRWPYAAPMTTEPLMFDHVVDGMFNKNLGKRLSTKARDELKAAGLDLSRPLRPAYPLTAYFAFLEIAGRDLFPGKKTPEQMYELGLCLLDGYLDTLMGKAIVNFAKLLGPARAIRRSERTWRQGNNFTEVTVVEHSDSKFELRFNRVGPYPEHTQGALMAALRINEELAVQVELTDRTPPGAVYVVSWVKK